MKYLALLLSLFATSGCHVAQLETQVAGLQETNESLVEDVHTMCAMSMEMMSPGVFYLGDDMWLTAMTGEVTHYKELSADCAKAAKMFKSAVSGREVPKSGPNSPF